MAIELVPVNRYKRRRAASPKVNLPVSPDGAPPRIAECAPPMTYHSLIHFVMSTTPADWLADDSTGIFLCKSDVNVRIVRAKTDKRIFAEEWAMDYPSKNPHPQNFTLWHGSSQVKTYFFVAVDGYRADLPMPQINTMNITAEQYAVANIVNLGGEMEGSYYEMYIGRFNVTDAAPVVTDSWD